MHEVARTCANPIFKRKHFCQIIWVSRGIWEKNGSASFLSVLVSFVSHSLGFCSVARMFGQLILESASINIKKLKLPSGFSCNANNQTQLNGILSWCFFSASSFDVCGVKSSRCRNHQHCWNNQHLCKRQNATINILQPLKNQMTTNCIRIQWNRLGILSHCMASLLWNSTASQYIGIWAWFVDVSINRTFD